MRAIALLLMATATLTLAEQAEKKPSARGQSTVFLHLGKKNLEKGELKSAESQLRFAVMTDPGNPQCHWHLGRVFEAQGKIEKAVEAFTETVRLQNSFADGHLALGKAHLRVEKECLKNGQTEKAVLARSEAEKSLAALKKLQSPLAEDMQAALGEPGESEN